MSLKTGMQPFARYESYTIRVIRHHLVAIRVGAKRVLCGQHGGRNQNARQDDVAKVVVIAEPVAKHAEPFTVEQLALLLRFKPVIA